MNDKKKILIIDDEPDVVTFLTTLLEDNGYLTVTATDGEEGLAKVKSERPDAVTLDITMPNTTGVRFYRELRESAEFAKLPVIMVTGVTGGFDKFISSRRQVPPPEGFVSKPIDQQKLLALLAKVLQ
ncbi:MAG: hypothetical protein A2284_10215 [Deltaproteobacteria bacterium RIFOXYA12_FULL_61_11]|nr:MAG: hypothetical protein A2284_10215 [Deltaproteobacteria bacterium RIFOXYA12_FULL_61_11]